MEKWETFLFLDVGGPKGTAQGYRIALNGRGVYVVGGGISQVATTLYLALKEEGEGVEITEYAVQDERIPRNTQVRVRFQENAYVMVDYTRDEEMIRGWIPMDILLYEEGC